MSFSCTRRVPFVYPEQKRNPKTLLIVFKGTKVDRM